MNERIHLSDDSHVTLNTGYCPNAPMKLYTHAGELRTAQQAPFGEIWDRPGIEALRDCINCYLDTGSFAALADTSAVPFVGKRMRVSDTKGEREVTVHGIFSDGFFMKQGDEYMFSGRDRHQFLPLTPPAPKVRPYTPEEAAKHLGRNVKCKDDICKAGGIIEAVDAKGVRCVGVIHHRTYLSLLNQFVWADDGSPCGIVED